VGFGLGFYAAPRGQPNAPPGAAQEYIGEARHVYLGSDAHEFDVRYPVAYVDPPELTVLTEQMNWISDYQLIEQRRDGFRIKLGSGAKNPNGTGSPWLKYRVRGVPAHAAAP
jgi:hypothetical protein